jgi:nitrite reductase/ring-hydroxylating ferredoxin subunit
MAEAKRSSTPVARVGEIPAGKSKKFLLPVGALEVECFVVNWNGGYHAYVNKCRHIAMSLDWVENRFFDEDGCFLLCATHGALYEPDSGRCVDGPPLGKRLIKVPLELRDGEILAAAPDDFEDVL